MTYSDSWYGQQFNEVLASAHSFTSYLWQHIQPSAVLDVGCGRGAWLKKWQDCGSKRLVGLDGEWNDQKMIDPSIEFISADLNSPFYVGRFDLAMSLEVAEHLRPEAARDFVDSLTRAADLVLFGAAYSHQGGLNHFNEQPHSYWGKLFAEARFRPFDILRPKFWRDEAICFWYRQNSFLYAKQDSPLYSHLISRGFTPMDEIGFMDCIHPALYEMKVKAITPPAGFKDHLRDLLPSFLRGVEARWSSRRRFKGNHG